MTRDEFRKLCLSRPVILDGATGTELLKRGLPTGVCPEKWVLENPQSIQDVQAAYRDAGSDIVYSCSFGGNRCKLEEFRLEENLSGINKDLAGLSVDVMKGKGFAFGDIAPTGKFVEPFGDMPFEEAVAIFREQAAALLEGGVEGFVIETMMDIQEARAALIGVREVAPDMPIMVTMTYGEDGHTLTGTNPLTALITLQSLGADAVGCNCSAGPDKMIEWVASMKPYAKVPLLAKPNAGQPKLVDGETVFDMGPEEYAAFFPKLIEAGANLLGGCCGSSPAHIAAVKDTVKSIKPKPLNVTSISAVSSAQGVAFLGNDKPFAVIGERINPTGKKKLQADLREGKMEVVRQFAQEQTRAGATLLDVNMGLSGIDEREMLLKAVRTVAPITRCPLCLDSSNPEVMEAALRLYPGRALLNSVSAEKERIEKMLPLAAKYGAMFVLLPVTDDSVPEKLKERQDVTKYIIEKAASLGLTVNDCVIDGLVMTVSSSPEAAMVTADFVEWCARKLGANTTGGISNVSFGMPERAKLNAAFLSVLIGRGLTTAIINPASEIMMDLKFASDALLGRDGKLGSYLSRYANAGVKKQVKAGVEDTRTWMEKAFDGVLLGDTDRISVVLADAVAAGEDPQALVNEGLIPAIIKVGELYDKKEYFLPQLMMSAEAMSNGFAALKEYLSSENSRSAGKVIMATVKGDIHDIGKNIVCLMLRNYGFEVVDLGKDVAAEDIVNAAVEHNAQIVGLSALMTTTMTQMKTVIETAQEMGRSDLKFMVGGAVVDQQYADEIGAAAFARDAVEAVRRAQELASVKD